MANLRLDAIHKTFPPAFAALDDVSFTLASGETLALVGPSGCGKSTLLRVIAGLEPQTSGSIFVADVDVSRMPAHRRDIAILLQRPAFLLYQSVRQNLRMAWTLGEPLSPLWRVFGAGKERDQDLARVANMLGLRSDLDRPVHQLSGGQQQRVALGRCLLRKSKITLLDEPLGHLDAPLRVELRRQIRALTRVMGLTVIQVTHDPAEAFAVGDRVAVLRDGRILQLDTPRELRRAPMHRFVAELVHHEDGGMNWVSGEIAKGEPESFFEGPFGRWPVSFQVLERLKESLYRSENIYAENQKAAIILGIPAAQVCCTTAPGNKDAVGIVMPVQELEAAATGQWIIAGDSRGRWVGHADASEQIERGQQATMTFSMNQAYWFDVATGRTLYAPTG